MVILQKYTASFYQSTGEANNNWPVSQKVYEYSKETSDLEKERKTTPTKIAQGSYCNPDALGQNRLLLVAAALY